MFAPLATRISRRKVLASASGLVSLSLVGSVLPATATVASARGQGQDDVGTGFFFHQTNLVSDVPGRASTTDDKLVNAWGITLGPTSPFWIADNGSGFSTVYNGAGQPFPPASPLIVKIPPPHGSAPDGKAAPTGIVFNGTGDFVVSKDAKSGPSRFLFATEDGTISGWSPAVDLANAILKVDNSDSGAVYKGLTMGSTGGKNYLYASNFRAGTIDIFNASFESAHLDGSFADPSIPTGFAPFNIQNLGGTLYVTYAKQDAAKHDDVKGIGNGFVNAFTTSGVLLRRVVTRFVLDSPWGLALAPPNFGMFSGALLVGNFGNGWISAYDPTTGDFKGLLFGDNHRLVQIDGLWGLTFGNGAIGGVGGDTGTLYFTAGPDGEQHGLFGSLSPVSPIHR